MTRFGVLRLTMTLACGSLVAGCGDDSTEPTPDTTPPAAVTAFQASALFVTGVKLTWNAPGDDGTSGKASSYEVRASDAPITEANFSAALPVTGEPAPAASGTAQWLLVLGLNENATYHFAIRAADEAGNVSPIANVTATTLAATGDVTAPGRITDLVVTPATPSSLTLKWTAPGDDGTTGTARVYDVRYATSALVAANFASATPVPGEPTPGAANTSESMTVTGLAPSTTYYFAIRTYDEVPNQSSVSAVGGATTLFQGALFPPPVVYAAAALPASVAIGDINNDTRPDLVVAASHSFSVLLGTGAGAFADHVDFGSGATFAALGHMNGDANLDLVAATGNVVVMLGNGNGAFGSAANFASGGATRLAIADLNADGKQDVVTANQTAHTVSVLLGNGDGTLASPTDILAGSNPADVAIGDVNGDGKLDLAVACRGSDRVAVMLGNGLGGFSGASYFVTGRNPVSVAIADLNGDGKRDLAVATETSIGVSVLLGFGNGTFGSYKNYVTSQFPSAVAVGDVDGDSKLDLVVSNGFSNSVSVLKGKGDGTFASKIDHPTGATPAWLALGDLSGDGSLDVATADLTGNSVSVLLNFGSPPDLMTRRR